MFNLNRFEEALQVIDKAFMINNKCQDVALVKVKILKKLGNFDEAERLQNEYQNMSKMEDLPLYYK